MIIIVCRCFNPNLKPLDLFQTIPTHCATAVGAVSLKYQLTIVTSCRRHIPVLYPPVTRYRCWRCPSEGLQEILATCSQHATRGESRVTKASALHLHTRHDCWTRLGPRGWVSMPPGGRERKTNLEGSSPLVSSIPLWALVQTVWGSALFIQKSTKVELVEY